MAARGRPQVADAGGEGREAHASGSPNLSSDSGCTWYSRLASPGPDRSARRRPAATAPWSSGRCWNSAYSGADARLAVPALPAIVFSVGVPRTLNAMRICRWSCRFSPTPGASAPPACHAAAAGRAGPMPDSCRICGEPMAPADRIISPRRRAPATRCRRRRIRRRCTPGRARRFRFSRRRTWLPVMMVRLPRRAAGLRKALAAFQRMPRFWLTSK